MLQSLIKIKNYLSQINPKRWIDSSLFFFLNLLFYIVFNQKNDIKIKTVLFIKLVGMGDAILQLSAIKEYQRRHPHREIHILTMKGLSGLYSYTWIHKVHVLSWSFYRHFKQFDLAYDLEPFMNLSCCLSQFFGKKNRGFRGTKRWINPKSTIPFPKHLHMVEVYHQLICPNNNNNGMFKSQIKEKILDKTNHLYKITISSKFASSHSSLSKLPLLHSQSFATESIGIKKEDLKKNIIVAIGSGSVAPARQWPFNSYYQLILLLLKNTFYHITLIGGNREIKSCQLMTEKISKNLTEQKLNKKLKLIDKLHNTTGKIQLKQLFFLLQNSLAFIGNDTGTVHIASACHLPGVFIFGPETHLRYGPYAIDNVIVNRKEHCSPCIHIEKGKNKTCHKPTCTRDIYPQQVFKALDLLLKEKIGTFY